MRGYLHQLRVSGGLREPGLVSGAVLTLTAIAFFRVPLLPELGRELAMTTFQLGLVTTIFAVGRFVADLPGGHFADRVRARSLIALSAVGVAAGSLVMGMSVAALTIYIGAFALGVSSSTTNATGMTFFSNVGGDSHRGTSMAVFSAALLAGTGALAIGPLDSVGSTSIEIWTWLGSEALVTTTASGLACAAAVLPWARQRSRVGIAVVGFAVTAGSVLLGAGIPSTIVVMLAWGAFAFAAAAPRRG